MRRVLSEGSSRTHSPLGSDSRAALIARSTTSSIGHVRQRAGQCVPNIASPGCQKSMAASRFLVGSVLSAELGRVDDRVFAATLPAGGDPFRVSVERMPGGGWDWTVWNSRIEPRYGATAACDAAMAAAAAAIGGRRFSPGP
jgi:hypothetical protein